MNSIEAGPDRQPEVERHAEFAVEPEKSASERTRKGEQLAEHVFFPVPATKLPVPAARAWAKADIDALRAIKEPEDRVEPMARMAASSKASTVYRDTLALLAPELHQRLDAAADRTPDKPMGPSSRQKDIHFTDSTDRTEPTGVAVADRSRGGSEPRAERDEEGAELKIAALQESLRKRYLIVDNKYYKRDIQDQNSKDALAFEDKGKRLATAHDDPDVAKSMVALAQAKGWMTIKVKGSDAFKREAWLAASLRGLDVEGYKADSKDLARLSELRVQQPSRPENEIAAGTPRERATSRENNAEKPSPPRDTQDQTPAQLSKRHEVAIHALKEVLHARGDSDQAVAMAAQVARERFLYQRVYVGKLLDFGPAPYENDPAMDPSYFVKLATKTGERTVWGVDLARAIDAGKTARGEVVALSLQGKKWVTIDRKDRGGNLDDTGSSEKMTALRNEWKLIPIETLRSEAKERLQRAAEISDHIERKTPVVAVYDNKAPRPAELERAGEMSAPGARPHERQVPR